MEINFNNLGFFHFLNIPRLSLPRDESENNFKCRSGRHEEDYHLGSKKTHLKSLRKKISREKFIYLFFERRILKVSFPNSAQATIFYCLVFSFKDFGFFIKAEM